MSTQRIIHCSHPGCTNPINPVGERFCGNCQMPLVYNYLWAVGPQTSHIQPGDKIVSRYEVITPRIWLDTLPGLLPEPLELRPETLSYLKLYQWQAHLPQVYGYAGNILLLENAPIDNYGKIYPQIAHAWNQATAVRQVYWLWQILQLWTPLSDQGVARSLLIPDNLRVQGWCVGLLEVVGDTGETTVQQLGECWQPWVENANTKAVKPLQKIVQQMCSGAVEWEAIATQLNQLLLSLAAELPLDIQVSGATDVGSQLRQNEDACFPTDNDSSEASLIPRVAIVCDGIGGHEGGEVASGLAIGSIKLQVRALLAEVAEQTELVPPELLLSQLEASLRVVNNVICNSNDQQNRAGTKRMATTVTMAVQIPQPIQTTSGWRSENAHEIYLAHVGDSRAYWITRNYCQLLTVDDDVAGREARQGRSLYRKALQRPDGTALTQALGTKNGEFLRPFTKRLIIEEDGILLLCSDGLSDGNLVEDTWLDYAVPVLTGELTPSEAVDLWIKLANGRNGHDNVSAVMSYYRVSPDYLAPVTSEISEIEIIEQPQTLQAEPELAESSQALLDLELTPEPPVTTVNSTAHKTHRRKRGLILAGLLLLLLGGTAVGLFLWWKYYPQSFNRACRRQTPLEQLCPD